MENQNESTKIREAARKVLDGTIRGTLKLKQPIRAQSTDLTELRFDFSKLTGWEYVEAMDEGGVTRNVFEITQRQALCLFAAAAGKATDGVDAVDVRTRIGMEDALRAVQTAMVFIVASARAENPNTSEPSQTRP